MTINVNTQPYLQELKAQKIIFNFEDVDNLPKAFIHYILKKARFSKKIIIKNANANMVKKIKIVANNLNFVKVISNNTNERL